ncbi:PadR family transcriptional regulator (plasmid) [Natrinema pallidum]|uniref:PadR family transcriptional regulator n=1 Tax=Natrinema pallidum TaxID=69527 RepID=A0A4P9TK68_9EURY|nr:helix-turn-helix transcriptional regulator [Natrinema pallidum]QCW05323.1 PadR family transcriptional regulator [Natrinema pallidum]
MPDLTGFQRDVLFVIAATEPVKGTKIKAEVEDYYGVEVNHGRLYPNLDELADSGLIEKGERDKRTNEYSLTGRREALLAQRQEWEAERFGEVTA